MIKICYLFAWTKIKIITHAGRLGETADLLNAIIREENKESGEVNLGHQYLEEGRMLNERFGDGFSVVYAVDGKK